MTYFVRDVMLGPAVLAKTAGPKTEMHLLKGKNQHMIDYKYDFEFTYLIGS